MSCGFTVSFFQKLTVFLHRSFPLSWKQFLGSILYYYIVPKAPQVISSVVIIWAPTMCQAVAPRLMEQCKFSCTSLSSNLLSREIWAIIITESVAKGTVGVNANALGSQRVEWLPLLGGWSYKAFREETIEGFSNTIKQGWNLSLSNLFSRQRHSLCSSYFQNHEKNGLEGGGNLGRKSGKDQNTLRKNFLHIFQRFQSSLLLLVKYC